MSGWMPSNHITLCHPPLLLPSLFPSTRIFSNESLLRIRWPNYWSFSFSINPSSEYWELIFFRIDWFDLLEVHGTLKSLLWHHSLKTSILQCSALVLENSSWKITFTSQAYICSPKARNLGVHTFNRTNKTGLTIRMAAEIKRGSNVTTRL